VSFPPHVMFYAPYKTNAEIGVDVAMDADGNPVAPAFVVGEGSPHALFIVPVVSAGTHAGHASPEKQ